MSSSRPFPIPVVPAGLLGPGSQSEDEPLNVLDMPRDMATYHRPSLPDPAAFASQAGALGVLRAVVTALADRLAGGVPAPIELTHLAAADRALVNQLLGEGEVAAQVLARQPGDAGLQAQESVFAGVWRVLQTQGGQVVRDCVEVGPVPQGLLDAARIDALATPSPEVVRPPDLMNAPSVLEELRDRARTWRTGDPAHVVNLTLLPLSAGDSGYLDAQLGAGRVVVLSRGYGNCRIVNTRLPRTWRVTYFNSSDIVILDTLEVGLIPEVACAATQDLEDSAERVGEVLAWVEAS